MPMMLPNEMGYDMNNQEEENFEMSGRRHRMSESSRRSGDSATRLPPQWGKRTTYDGQVYYFNKVTDETCWDIDEINPETGELMTQRSAIPQERPPSAGPNNNDYRSTTARILESELTWNSLLQEITHSIQLLNQSAQLKRKDLYVQQSTTVVEIIRLMLYASGTVKHDIQHYPNYQILKQQNKNIMHTLNLLVFATKTASQVWPPPDAALKMQQAANDVLGAVRQFIMSAQDADIKLDKSLIDIRPEENHDDQEEAAQGSSELIAQLEQCAQEIYSSTQKLISTLNQPEYQTSFLITQTKSIVTDVGRFLSVVDEVQYDNMNSEATRQFKVNRIALCNNISGLVMSAQNAVTPIRPNNANEQVILGAGLVEKGVKDFMISVKYLLQEKEVVETENCQKMINEYSRRPSAISEHINQQYYMDPQMRTRGRRAVSLSAINSNLNEIPENGENPILSAQEDNRERPYPQRNLVGSMASPGRGLEQQFAEFNINGAPVDGRYNERKTSTSSKNKLKQLLGDEAPNETSASTPDLNTKPWYLNYDYGSKDIVFNMEGKVKGATFPALIERLTIHDSHDSSFTQTFLLTYRSFATSMEVIDALIKRFCIKPPPQLTNPQDLKIWNEKKAMPIRLRVCNVLKSWIETYSLDLQGNQDDAKALETVRQFFSSQAASEHANLANTILKALEKRDAGTGKKLLLNLNKEAPPPILPRNLNYLRFLDIDPLEIARQLTIMESKTYALIQPIECLNKAWSERENSPAINVKAMIEFSNKTTGWVATAILRENELKRRCNVLKHFILVADRCYSLNNFNTVMSILAGFNSSPIHRLKRTWEQLSKKMKDMFDNLEEIMNPQKNYAQYRENLHSVNPPCVPFLGVYLTDLTFIEDGNTNNLKTNNQLINFSKQNKTAEVIREIQQYQNQPYNLNPVKEICDFVLKCLNETVDETTLYNMSLILEPREREDEVIARKLQESGFL
ncbi:ras GEF [Neocallimastix lanati (nom. inval.)]|nr:ras GEF [Neocallimastix sp. JGI-2020a]